MKKFLALAALVLGLASCQTEPEGLDVNVGGNQLVNFAVGLPEATRTSSGTGFDLTTLEANNLELRYILEIYVEGDTENRIRKEAFSTDSQVVFPVRLIPGRNYRVVAWTDIVPEDANRTEGGDYDHYYETSAGLTAVTIVENTEIKWNAMDEKRDAFTAFQTINNFSANTTINLTLHRPFAKIRVVSTDIKDIEDLGFELGTGEVEYGYDMNRKFNAYNGTSSDASYKTHALAYPTPYAASSDAYETATQRTLYADYIFVDNIENPDVVQFSLTVNDKSGNLIKTTAFNTDIPVHANKLTTLIGEVLTEGGHVKITVDNNLQETERVTVVSSASHLLQVVNAGGEYILGNNIVVTEDDKKEIISLATRANEPKTTTINLNGYTITLKADIVVEAGNTLNIKNQPVNNSGNELGAIVADGGAIVNYGTLNIEGGVFNVASVKNYGTVNISGGVFADGAIVNNGTANVEGENADRADKIVTNGAEAIVSKIVYTVEELQAALNKGAVDQIIFGDNLVGDATIVQKEGVNVFIDGAGKKFDGTLYIHGDSRYKYAETVKIANVNFESETAKYFIDSNGTSGKERYAHNVTIENCTFTSLAADNSVAVCGPRFRQAYNITLKGCTATNTFFLAWFTGCKNLRIEGCEAINNYEGVTFGPCNNSVIKDSKIDAELYGVRYDPTTEAYNVTIENCELSGFIPVSVRNIGADDKPINVKFVGNNTLTKGGLYDVVFAANEYKSGVAPKLPTGEWTIEGADNYVVFPRENKVSNVDQLKEAVTYAQDGYTIALDAGEYVIPSAAQGKTIKFVGTGSPEDTKVAVTKVGTGGENCDYGLDGSTVTFENITITTNSSTYIGYARCNGTYKNCIINGTYTLYGDSVFENCTFNVSGDVYNIWTWGAPTATFTNCTFNCDGKAMLLYGTANTKLTMNNCVFNDNGSISGKAAIETGNDYGKSYELTVNNVTVNGFDINPNGFVTGTTLWANKNSMPASKLKVTVDGKNAYNYVAAADDTQSFTDAINNGATEVALSNGNYTMPEPDLRGKTLTISGTKDVVIDATAVNCNDQFVTGANISFEGVTVNFGNVNYMGFANAASLSYKNCKINGLQFLYGPVATFENCEFDSNGAEHSVWTYGCKEVNFIDCDFTYGDRCVNCYKDQDIDGGKQVVNFTNCTFTTENTASLGAVEINSSAFSVGIEVNLDGCTAPAYGQIAWVSSWDSTHGAKTTINIK